MEESENKVAEKSGKGLKISLILASILACAGIGFGIWAIIDGSAQKDELNKKIADLEKQIKEKETEKDTKEKEEDENEESPKEEDNSTVIYVEKWGYKFIVPDTLENVSYRFHSGEGLEDDDLCVTAKAKGYETTSDYIPATTCLSRKNKPASSSDPNSFWYERLGQGEFYYEGPHAMSNEKEIDAACEGATISILAKWFTDEKSRIPIDK